MKKVIFLITALLLGVFLVSANELQNDTATVTPISVSEPTATQSDTYQRPCAVTKCAMFGDAKDGVTCQWVIDTCTYKTKSIPQPTYEGKPSSLRMNNWNLTMTPKYKANYNAHLIWSLVDGKMVSQWVNV